MIKKRKRDEQKTFEKSTKAGGGGKKQFVYFNSPFTFPSLTFCCSKFDLNFI